MPLEDRLWGNGIRLQKTPFPDRLQTIPTRLQSVMAAIRAMINEPITRDSLLEFLAGSSVYGNLGLFIGAGFSRAVLRDSGTQPLRWGQLIEKAAVALGVDYSVIQKEEVSLPEIATAVCEELARKDSLPFNEARTRLKNKAAELTNWLPDKSQIQAFQEVLRILSPQWIVTTNYDLVIESTLTGCCRSLGPHDVLCGQHGVIPVYHLHGSRREPASLVITQEDYVALFRPSDYRHSKLSIAIKESTIVFLGYSLGDVNVLTAVDWSRNVFCEQGDPEFHDIVQVVRCDNPRPNPFRRQDFVIVETAEILEFLSELSDAVQNTKQKHANLKQKLEVFSQDLYNPPSGMIDRFIDDAQYRQSVLQSVNQYELALISGFMDFLAKCVDEAWRRSEPRGAFEPYDKLLSVLLDIFETFDVISIQPALFHKTAETLERVFNYVGEEAGQSWAAAKTWANRKEELPKKTVRELCEYGRQHGYGNLTEKLGEVAAAFNE